MQNVGLDWAMDTPQTVTTTRAAAALKIVLIEMSQYFLDHPTYLEVMMKKDFNRWPNSQQIS